MKKKDIYNFIKAKLQTDRIWQTHALMAIFNRQTESEKNVEATMLHNDVGFTGCDGQILASFAKQWLSRKWLSEKQFALLEKRIPRYWHQIYDISDKTKLETQATSWTQSITHDPEATNAQIEMKLQYDSGEE